MLGLQDTGCLLKPKSSNLEEKDEVIGDGFWQCPISALTTGGILLNFSGATPKIWCCEQERAGLSP